MNRLEQTLNKPMVVIVAGVVAVALNVLLYFGVFLPRMTPLIANVHSLGTSLPEAMLPQAIVNSDSEANGKADSESSSKSDSEASNESDSEAGGKPDSEASSEVVPETSPEPDTGSPAATSSASPPESPPQQQSSPTPQQHQYL